MDGTVDRGTPAMRPGRGPEDAGRRGAGEAVEPLLTEDQAAVVLRVSPRTLQGWRQRDEGPAYVKLGAAVRYRRCDLKAYIVASLRGDGARCR